MGVRTVVLVGIIDYLNTLSYMIGFAELHIYSKTL